MLSLRYIPIRDVALGLLTLQKYREFQRFLDGLLDSGVLSREDYVKISRMVVELMRLRGEQFRKKAEEIIRVLQGATRVS